MKNITFYFIFLKNCPLLFLIVLDVYLLLLNLNISHNPKSIKRRWKRRRRKTSREKTKERNKKIKKGHLTGEVKRRENKAKEIDNREKKS